MTYLNQLAHQVFARQHGVASIEQLTQAGHSTADLKQLQRRGAIVQVVRGAYRVPGAPFDELSRCAAVCLARPTVAIAGPTAARMWGFRRMPKDQRIHIIGPRASQPAIAAWVVTYRTEAIHDDDKIQRNDGIRLTTRARTALDLGRFLTAENHWSVIEQAMHDGNVTEQEMRSVATDWISPRRRWVRQFLELMGQRIPGPAAESHPEVRFAEALIRGGINGLTRQHKIVLPGYGQARFDLAITSLRWAIEIDVFPTHGEPDGRIADAKRDAAALAVGWETTRISRDGYPNHFDAEVHATLDAYFTRCHASAMSQRVVEVPVAHRSIGR